MASDIRTSAVSVAEGIVARDNLAWIADRWPDLRARLRPAGAAEEVRTKPKSRPPIDLQISDLMFEIEEEVRSLGHVLMDETEWEPATSSMPGLLREVIDRYGHFVTGDDRTALAFYDWAEDYRGRVKRALENPPSSEFIGLCASEECGGEVYAKRGAGTGKCTRCKGRVDVRERRQEIKDVMRERLVRQHEIPAALLLYGHYVPIGTVKSWVHRKRLMAHGGMYRISEALQLAERHVGESA